MVCDVSCVVNENLYNFVLPLLLITYYLLKAFYDILINEVSLSEELVVIVTRKLIGISFIFAPDFRLERDQVFFLIKKGIKEKKVEV